MQAEEIQQTLEAKGVPTDKAVPAAKVLAQELRDSTRTRTSEEQTIITAAWEFLKNK